MSLCSHFGETISQAVLAQETNRRQLQQIISGLSDGVILAEIDQSILWANEAALAMHGLDDIAGLGANTAEYAERFALRYRNNHPLPLEAYPLSRVANGEEFSDVVVEVTPSADTDRTWVHRLRSLALSTGPISLQNFLISSLTRFGEALRSWWIKMHSRISACRTSRPASSNSFA